MSENIHKYYTFLLLPVCDFLLFEESHSIGYLEGKVVQLLIIEDVLERLLVLHNRVGGCISIQMSFKKDCCGCGWMLTLGNRRMLLPRPMPIQ